MEISKKLRDRRKELNLTMLEVAQRTGVSEATVSRWESGDIANMRRDKIVALAKALQVAPAFIMGWDEAVSAGNSTKPEENSNVIFLDEHKIHMIPLFESVSAGFGATAANEIIDYIPCYIENEAEAFETLCIKVKGDSMFPKIEEGDIIQVRKQTSVDSGSIAVVLVDRAEGMVKKVVYGKDWIELHSINPMYPIQEFKGPDVQRLEVVGLVKKIIKNV